MRLLHVITTMDPKAGGVCQAVRSIIIGLAENNVQNEVVCLDDEDAPFLGNANHPVHALGCGTGPWFYNKKLKPWLVENCPRFDGVVLHGLWQYPGYALEKVVAFLRKENKYAPRFFVMPHGMLDPYFQRAKSRRLKAIRNRIYWKLIEGGVVNGADALLFTCEEERRLAREPFKPYQPKQELIVGLGIEEPAIERRARDSSFEQKHRQREDETYLLFLSRIHEKKGVEELIDAYALFLEKKGRAEAKNQDASPTISEKRIPKLVVAGPGWETPYGERIKQKVAASKTLSASVRLLGMQKGVDKWNAFHQCEAFVLPSHQENFGIAVVEALACGKPVLISNQVNIWREIAECGGAFVADDTVAGIEQVLAKWTALSSEEKRTMGENARTAYEKHFTLHAAAQNFLKAVQQRATCVEKPAFAKQLQ